MYCSRYKKECEEALYLNCDVPASSSHIDEEIEECRRVVDQESPRIAGQKLRSVSAREIGEVSHQPDGSQLH